MDEFELGLQARQRGDILGALPRFQCSWQARPADGQCWYWYAAAQDNLGMDATAVACYRRALELGCSREAEAHAYLSSSLEKRWRPDAALREIGAAIALDPGPAIFHVIRGNVRTALRRMDGGGGGV